MKAQRFNNSQHGDTLVDACLGSAYFVKCGDQTRNDPLLFSCIVACLADFAEFRFGNPVGQMNPLFAVVATHPELDGGRAEGEGG